MKRNSQCRSGRICRREHRETQTQAALWVMTMGSDHFLYLSGKSHVCAELDTLLNHVTHRNQLFESLKILITIFSFSKEGSSSMGKMFLAYYSVSLGQTKMTCGDILFMI